MRKPSKKKRILKEKPAHVIDASVLFGYLDKRDKANQKFCERYLRAISHKYRGFTTIPLIGETFLAISHYDDRNFKQFCFDYFDALLRKNDLGVIPISKNRDEYANFISKMRIKEDDATHLSNVVKSSNTIFVTLDKDLVSNRSFVTRKKLKERFNLEIYHPEELIKKLSI